MEQQSEQTQHISLPETPKTSGFEPETHPPFYIKHQIPIVYSLLGLMIVLLLFISIFHFPQKDSLPKWEYKVYRFYSASYDRTGSEAAKFTTVLIDDEKLDEFGEQGWELVSSTLEMETAYPNFGNSDYVTGIQPNIRPQLIICVFKREVKKR